MKSYLTRETRGVGRVAAALLAFAVILVSGCAPKSTAGLPFDLQFIDTMTAHHEGAIEMARVVETKAVHAELKDFARQVVEVQAREVAQMAQWRAQWFSGKAKTVNMGMPGMAESMKGMDTGHLQMLSGAEFDRMFIDMMIPHHEGAVVMAKDALVRAQHSEIKGLAQSIIDAQQREIEMMNRWKEEWKAAK